MNKRILFVDDDTRVLQAFERQLHKQFEIQTALGPEPSAGAPLAGAVQAQPATANAQAMARVRRSRRRPPQVPHIGSPDPIRHRGDHRRDATALAGEPGRTSLA